MPTNDFDWSPDFGSSSTNPFDSLVGSFGENDSFENDVDRRRQSLSTNAIKVDLGLVSQESANRSISPLEMFQNLSGKNLKCF